jgi:hypothetical protein
MLSNRRPPIFVVGCQRSGTTLLRLILDSHPNISCGPETRFLADLEHVTGSSWPRLSQYGFSRQYWHLQIAGMFDTVKSDYARQQGKERWADKTPLYALSLGFIGELFPTCQVIHVIRDGRDVVASHRARWGYLSAVKAASKWPRYIRAARTAGGAMSPSRYLEVRYEDLVGEPEKTLRELLTFLDEPWDPSVLEHDRRPHDVPERYRLLASARRRMAGESGAIYRNRVGAHRRELDPLLRLLCRVVAGGTLRELGYS